MPVPQDRAPSPTPAPTQPSGPRDLDALLADLPVWRRHGPGGPVAVTALSDHSARLVPGALFFCVPGASADGHRFAPAAVAAGAAALVVERRLPELDAVPQAEVPDVRSALAAAARAFHGTPDRRLHVLAVTGTNGKTTTAFMMQAIWSAARRRTALLGTVCYRLGRREFPAPLTTPGPLLLHALLAEAVADGATALALEASSHALAQKRLEGVEVDTAVFTNLTHDHLDYHGNAMAYLAAKRLLFGPRGGGKPHPALAVVGTDGAAGRLIAREARACRQVLTYGLREPADVLGRYHAEPGGPAVLGVEGAWGRGEVRLTLPGAHNARNALGAMAAALGNGIPFDVASHALRLLPPVPGRHERVDDGQPFAVIVDFAHNPDGLRQTLQTARRGCTGALRLVFGCKGGDGDADKRRRMGEIAARLADDIYLTTDDPYREDPEAIAAVVASGLTAAGASPHLILDRAAAVRAAISAAQPGDVVVVAGRGHEVDQPIGGALRPCDDRQICRQALAERRGWAGQPNDEAVMAAPGTGSR